MLSTTRLDAAPPRRVALAILAYVAILAVIRLSLSSFLEIDEAQFVGAVDLRLSYGNSHPPLYNWLVRGALELTGWDWPAAVTLVRGTLLAATYLLVFDAGRRVAGTAGGLVALAATALMPQVSWMSAHTLAHSLLATAGAAGVVHALVLVVTRPGAGAFLWLGIAAAVGILGKFNVAVLLAALAVAVASVPAVRARFARRSALLAPLAFGALAGPVLAALVGEPAERLDRLYKKGPFAPVDLPGVGIDGVLSLAVAALASVGVVLAALALFGRGDAATAPLRRVLWRTLAFGLGGFAVAVLAGDVALVDERYLTPLTMVVPLLAALGLASAPARRWFVLAGAAAFVAVPIGIELMVLLGNHRFARPYAEVSAPLAAALPSGVPVAVAAEAQDLAANIVLGLRGRGVDAHLAGDPLAPTPDAYVRLRASATPFPEGEAVPPPGFCPSAMIRTDVPLNNLSGRRMPFAAAIAVRC